MCSWSGSIQRDYLHSIVSGGVIPVSADGSAEVWFSDRYIYMTAKSLPDQSGHTLFLPKAGLLERLALGCTLIGFVS